jgi:hypothetical protein
MGSILSRQKPSMQVALENIQGVRERANMLDKEERAISEKKLKKIEIDILEYIELFKEMR